MQKEHQQHCLLFVSLVVVARVLRGSRYRFDFRRGRETKAYQVQKLSKTRDHIFSETLNYMALFFFGGGLKCFFFLSLSLSVSLSFFPDKTDATTFSLLHHAQTKPGTRLSRDSPTKTRDG